LLGLFFLLALLARRLNDGCNILALFTEFEVFFATDAKVFFEQCSIAGIGFENGEEDIA
jgi:hypothetical protein